jgi:hypothetical protein
MQSPRQWLRQWLGLNEPRVEITKDFDDEGGIFAYTVHLPDEKAIKRRKILIAIAMNPWTMTIGGGLIVAAIAKLLGLI